MHAFVHTRARSFRACLYLHLPVTVELSAELCDNHDMEKRMKTRLSRKVTAVLLAIALGMCVYGAATGEMEAVFIKAVKICMECIGLG